MQGLTSGRPCPASQADAVSAERCVSAPSHYVLTLGIALELQPLMFYCAHWPARREELWVIAPPLASGICYGQVDMALRVTQPHPLILRSPWTSANRKCPLLLCFYDGIRQSSGLRCWELLSGLIWGFPSPTFVYILYSIIAVKARTFCNHRKVFYQ